EVCGRQVVDEPGLRDVEDAEVALADVLRLLERRDRLDELPFLDIASAERAIDADESERELALGAADRFGGLEVAALGLVEPAEQRLDHAEAEQVVGVARAALGIRPRDEILGRPQRGRCVAGCEESISSAPKRV